MRRDIRVGSSSRPTSVAHRVRSAAASAIVVGGTIFLGGAASLVTAFAHSGTVAASESCQTWAASVTLNHNVTIDRFVDVVTTIPGTTGITNGHYDTSKGLIWDAAGPAPATGTVTLSIYLSVNGNPGGLEFTTNASIKPATNCLASPSISTKQSAGGAVGTVISDTATVAGGSSPTGTVTFSLYEPGDSSCDSDAVYTHTATLSSAGKASSGSFTTTAVGTYRWIAQYSGDASNKGATSGCQDEAVTVVKAGPAISTEQSAGGTVGSALADTATVTGGNHPTGTVTFNLYGPGDTTCAAHAVYTDTANLSSAGRASSGSFTSTAAGTYRWIAQYSGDANNTGATSGCQDEAVTVVKAGPAISTTPSAGGTAPKAISDSATVSGGVSPTGTVTFKLFGTTDATCAGAAIFSSTVNLTSATVHSGSFTATAAGTYHWTAAYSGDANNAAAISKCADESAVVTAPGGVQAITTPSTGDTAALGEMTLGGFALLAGLGVWLIGANVPRRRRI